MTTGAKWTIGCTIIAVLGAVTIVLAAFGLGLLWRTRASHAKPPAIQTAESTARQPETPELPHNTNASAPMADRVVLVASDEQAYAVFIRIPATRLEEIKEKASGWASAQVVSWESFKQDKDRHIRSHIVKDDYPQHRVADGLVALLAKNEGIPIGLTWNGGIAITYNDYQHAKRTFRLYQEDASAYIRTRNTDPRADPVHPRAHFEPLLGDPYLSDMAEDAR